MLYLKENHQEIDAVIFDLGNVLLDYSPDRFLSEVGIQKIYHERVGNVLFNDPEVWSKLDLGTLDDAGILKQAIRREPELTDELTRYVENWANYFVAIPENVETFYRIKDTGTRVYALSNFSRDCMKTIKEHNAFMFDFDGMIISYEHGIIKPQPEIYRLLIDTYQINTERAVFIDDIQENVQAARDAGLLAIHYPKKADIAQYFIFPTQTENETEMETGVIRK